MSDFHLYQCVRIVSLPNIRPDQRLAYAYLVGMEGVIDTINPRLNFPFVADYGVSVAGLRVGLDRDNIEPIKYLPSPEDFVSLERSPDFDCPLPHEVRA